MDPFRLRQASGYPRHNAQMRTKLLLTTLLTLFPKMVPRQRVKYLSYLEDLGD